MASIFAADDFDILDRNSPEKKQFEAELKRAFDFAVKCYMQALKELPSIFQGANISKKFSIAFRTFDKITVKDEARSGLFSTKYKNVDCRTYYWYHANVDIEKRQECQNHTTTDKITYDNLYVEIKQRASAQQFDVMKKYGRYYFVSSYENPFYEFFTIAFRCESEDYPHLYAFEARTNDEIENVVRLNIKTQLNI